MLLLDDRNFLKVEFDNQGLVLLDAFEDFQIIKMEDFCQLALNRRAEILLVDTQSILNYPELQEKFKMVMNTFLGVIFFYEKENLLAKDWVEKHSGLLKKMIGEYSIPMPENNWSILSNQIQFLSSILEDQKSLQKHIVSFGEELNSAMQLAEEELIRAKKIHEILIPKKSDEIKGISFLNKYAVGSGEGSEFFDLHHCGNKAYQILITSESYLISSCLISILNQHKQGKFSPKDFIKISKNEIQAINQSKNRKSMCEVIVLEVDTTELTLKAHGWGRAEIFGSKLGKIDLGLGTLQGSENSVIYQLARSEKIIVFSPGFIFNWNEGRIKHNLYTFLKEHHHLSLKELLLELFLQLGLAKNSEFLSKDATVVMMEVNRHGIHQI